MCYMKSPVSISGSSPCTTHFPHLRGSGAGLTFHTHYALPFYPSAGVRARARPGADRGGHHPGTPRESGDDCGRTLSSFPKPLS